MVETQKMSPILMGAAHRLAAEPEEYVLCNGTPEDIEFESAGCAWRESHGNTLIEYDAPTRTMTGGMRIRVPAATSVVPRHPRAVAGDPHFEGFHSIQRKDGTYIPGTLVVKEVREVNQETNILETMWNPQIALKKVFGIDSDTGEFSLDQRTGKYMSPYMSKGLRLLPRNPTEEQIEIVKADSREHWEDFVFANDQETVRNYHRLLRESQHLGTPPPVLHDYIRRAMERVNLLGQRRKSELADTLGFMEDQLPGKPEESKNEQIAQLIAGLGALIERANATMAERPELKKPGRKKVS